MSTTSYYYHFVISTYRRRKTINEANENALYTFIWKILQQHNCVLFRIGGIEDHVHILLSTKDPLNPSDLVRDFKRQSSHWMKRCWQFPEFEGWSRGYFGATRSKWDIPSQSEYIKTQKLHHKGRNTCDELHDMYLEEGYEWTKYHEEGVEL